MCGAAVLASLGASSAVPSVRPCDVPIVRVAAQADLVYLTDREHLANHVLNDVVMAGRILLVGDHPSGEVLGWLRWGLFWDEVPFMNRLFVREDQRRKGLGRQLVTEWEARCRESGYGRVMTSTQSNEEAQHFYRRLGYRHRVPSPARRARRGTGELSCQDA